MINHLALHDATALQIQQFLTNPSHALLIAGPDGIGKTAIAEGIICMLLQLKKDSLATYPHVSCVTQNGTSISIDAIRDVQRFLQLKTIGTNPYRRAVLIEHAQSLTLEAQNAFLKLLEEPPADTLMVLTVNSPRALLPTILSRLQTITVHTPAEAQVQTFLKTFNKNEATTKQAYFLSGGLPGLLHALLGGTEDHPLLASVTTAKEILQKQSFERLAMVDSLAKQKEAARGVLEALERIAQAGLHGATVKQDAARIKQWHTIRKATLAARQAIEASANTKLALTNLFLKLS